MSQAIQKTNHGVATIETMLEARKDFLAKVLPKHMTAERLIKVALFARSRNPKLLQCTPESLLKAIMESAELGLEPSGSIGGAHLVPFDNNKTGKTEVTLIPDYRGLIDLARRSGQILSIDAHVIHKGDKYKVRHGMEPVLEHEPLLDGDPGEMVAVYAVAKLRDGATQCEVMTKAAIDKIRGRSRAGKFGPWVTDYEAMAKKTVLRQLCKYLPRSREMVLAMDMDDALETGDAPMVDLALPVESTKTESVKAKLKAKNEQPPPNPGPVVDVAPGEEEAEAIARMEREQAEQYGPGAQG